MTMKRMFFSSAVIALVTLIGCSEQRFSKGTSNVSLPGQTKSDADQLQGSWRIESSRWNGVEDPEIAKTVAVRFQGDKFIVVDKDGNSRTETIQLNPGLDPKTIDCTNSDNGRPSPGIYTLEGDVFTWCSSGGGNTIRPIAFSSQPGSKQSLIVLRRVKPRQAP